MIATLSERYLTAKEIILQSLKSIGASHDGRKEGQTDSKYREKNFAFNK